jgi:sugar O-acyltransferase (sialic acid O-acetyltransferase NeuD family)
MTSSAPRLLILGCGTFAVQTLEIAEEAGGFAPAGFINSFETPLEGTQLEGLPVFGIEALAFGPRDALVVSGAVSNRRRAAIEVLSQRGYGFATLVHPTAYVSRRAALRAGVVINSGVQLSVYVELGPHVIVNRAASIGHHTRIGAFATVGPGTTIAGAVTIGEGAYVGAGSVLREGSVIGAGAIVGAGAVVVKPVAAHTLVMGVPASVVRTGVDGL